MRSPSGSCSKCASAEAETDRTPVCFVFVFHSSFVVNTVRAPFEALIRDCYSAPYRRLEQAKVWHRSLRLAFVRGRRFACLFIYELYMRAAPAGECVAGDNELITWFIYGLLLGSPPNTTWFSCSVEHGALFRSSRLVGVCVFLTFNQFLADLICTPPEWSEGLSWQTTFGVKLLPSWDPNPSSKVCYQKETRLGITGLGFHKRNAAIEDRSPLTSSYPDSSFTGRGTRKWV